MPDTTQDPSGGASGSTATPTPRVAVLLAERERFDGSGGAVATWVKEVYTRWDGEAAVFSPALTRSFAGDLYTAPAPWYVAYDAAVTLASKAVGALIRRSWWSVYTRAPRAREMWLASVIRRVVSYDVVHIHNRPQFVVPLRTAGFTGRIVLHMHNDLSAYVTKDGFAALVAAVDDIAFCSRYLMDKAVGDFGDLPGSVLYNGVAAPGDPADAPRDPLRTVFAGRLTEGKGVDRAVAICAELNSRGIACTLDIYGATSSGTVNGATPFSRQLDELVAETNAAHGARTVQVRGPIDHATLLTEMRGASYLLYPCQWEEPFGMVVVEAMGVGTVPVASRVGGIPEIVDSGSTGVLVEDFTSVTGFVDVVQELVGDPERVAALSAAGVVSAAQKFSWQSIADDLDALLRRD